MGLLHIYDDDDWRMSLASKRDDAQATLPITGGFQGLVDQLDSVLASGWHFNRILFETHGIPGEIDFGGDPVNAQRMRTMSSYHYETIAEVGTRLYFNGCNVAEGDSGWDFLRAAAEVFLIGQGGLAFGHTSIGWCNPFTGHVVHPWGDTRYVVMAAGGDA